MTSKVTRDGLVDRLPQGWERVRERLGHRTTSVLNLDNGPENHSRRTRCMLRLLEVAQHAGLRVRLAYAPSYHSKCNPLERCWGSLEHQWTGTVRDSIDAVLGCAASMTWKGQHPVWSW